MKIKQTILILALIFGISGLLVSRTVYADCGGVETTVINCEQSGGDGKDVKNTGIWGILLIAINILTAGIGVAAIGGIVYGSILYASAGGGPEQVKKAKEIIVNVVIGLVAYALMYAFLNFIIPGGLFT